MYLEIECQKCRVANTCPNRNSSPLNLSGKRHLCRIIGGYGRVPVDDSILSPESSILAKTNGPCLTIAEIPREEDGEVVYEIVKIFSPPVLNERETTNEIMDRIIPKSHD